MSQFQLFFFWFWFVFPKIYLILWEFYLLELFVLSLKT